MVKRTAAQNVCIGTSVRAPPLLYRAISATASACNYWVRSVDVCALVTPCLFSECLVQFIRPKELQTLLHVIVLILYRYRCFAFQVKLRHLSWMIYCLLQLLFFFFQ